MPITTVLLDAGGVLLDESDQEAANAQVASEVLGITTEAYFGHVAEAVRTFVPRVYPFVFWREVAPDRSAFESLYGEYRERMRRARPPLRLMAGILPELQRLHGRLRLGIAGQYGRELLEVLDAGGILELLSWRFTQDDFELTKPDPRFLIRIAEACGVEPAECIMVGDRIDKDVIPAHQVGMRTIRIRNGLHRDQEPRLPEEIPDVELESVAGLAEAARALAAR